MREQEWPKLRLTTNRSIKLKGFYHANIIAIVILKGNSAVELQQLRGLEETLHGRQHTHILFIADRNTGNDFYAGLKTLRSWHWLFDWCWAHGYLNVLLFSAWSSENPKAIEIFTYTPFPSLRVHHATLSGYLEARREPANLQGLIIRTGIGDNPPRALLYQDKQGNHIVRGMAPELLRLFAWRYNAKLEFVRVSVPPNKLYMALLCVEMLIAGQLDVCADFFITSDMVPTSQSVFLFKGYLIVRYPRPVASYLYLSKPFSSAVWRVLLITFIFIIIFTTGISRFQLGAWHFAYFLLEVISSVLQTTFKLTLLRGRVQQLMFLLLALCGFVISSIYLTCLSSILTTQIFERQIESFEDLRDLNIPILITLEDKQLAEFYSFPAVVQELFEVTPFSTIKATQNVLDPRYAQLIFFDKCMLLLYRQRFLRRPRAMALDTPVEILSGGIPIKQNWAFQHLLDIHMLQMFAYGFHAHALEQGLEESLQHSNFSTFQTEYREVAPLNMAYFEMPALLLGCGYAMSLGSFLSEFMLYRLKTYFMRCVMK